MNAISGIASTSAPVTASGPPPRLVRAAHEFEAQLMKELLKPMTAPCALTGDEEGDADDAGSAGVLGEFASEALGRSLSEQGGLGIANSILHSFSHTGNGARIANLSGNIVIDSSCTTKK